jgi:LacI family transcriptional regulator
MARAKRVLLVGLDSFQGRETLKGIRRYWQAHGEWEFRAVPTAMDIDRCCQRLSKTMESWKPDGIIGLIRNQRLHDIIYRARLPAVSMSGALLSKIPQVLVNNRAIGRMVARHFLANGLRHFGYCNLDALAFARERCAGFAEELKSAGFDCAQLRGTAKIKDPSTPEYHSRLRTWLNELKKPVGVMANYDYQGTEVIWIAQQAGLNVPADVAVVGADNDEQICEFWTPPLSSVEMGSWRCGYEAMSLMDRMIRGAKPPRSPSLLDPLHVTARQSSDVLAVADPDIAAAVRFIRNHVNRPITVDDVLQEVPISRRSLERRFYEVLRLSPRAEINRVRLERAKELLSDTDLPIPDVSSGSGFLRHANFSAFFKRITRMTPLEFRHSMRTPEKPGNDLRGR